MLFVKAITISRAGYLLRSNYTSMCRRGKGMDHGTGPSVEVLHTDNQSNGTSTRHMLCYLVSLVLKGSWYIRAQYLVAQHALQEVLSGSIGSLGSTYVYDEHFYRVVLIKIKDVSYYTFSSISRPNTLQKSMQYVTACNPMTQFPPYSIPSQALKQ